MKRASWDEYFMKFAFLAAERTTCLRRSVGAILVRDKQILATGYNGAPRGIRHCVERGCIRDEMKVPSGERAELCYGTHAEINLLVQAARTGVMVCGATLYSTTFPCSMCAKALINAGVVEVVYSEGYPDKMGGDMLKEAEICCRQFVLGEKGE